MNDLIVVVPEAFMFGHAVQWTLDVVVDVSSWCRPLHCLRRWNDELSSIKDLRERRKLRELKCLTHVSTKLFVPLSVVRSPTCNARPACRDGSDFKKNSLEVVFIIRNIVRLRGVRFETTFDSLKRIVLTTTSVVTFNQLDVAKLRGDPEVTLAHAVRVKSNG